MPPISIVEQLHSVLSDRYGIEREIGAGGMATVYLARDIKHNRKVALKLLRPELGALLGTERFLSEINVTANLQHPHLLPLFDSGEAGGLLFYVMPFVEGESLRARLEREQQLPVEDAVRIAREVADALGYAHAHGVVHRDIKPENILLSGGHALVTDFGIAAAIDVAGGSRLTETGIAMGTPRYMSPEQALGQRTVDGRADIYALGCVLYEMLAGEPPFSGPTPQSVVARVLTEKPQSLRIRRESVPEHVDATIAQALAKLPADRFSNASEFTAALTGARPIANTAVTHAVPKKPRPLRVKPLLPWVISAVAVLSLATTMLRGSDRDGRNAEPARFEVVLPDSASLTGGIALSPNGSQLVYQGRDRGTTRLYLRRLEDPDVRPIAGTEGASSPTFSTDGAWILFVAASKLMKVPATGGEPSVVADSVITSFSSFSAANRDEVVFPRVPGILWRLSAHGGTPTLLARPDSSRDHLWYYLPEMLPGGKALLITLYKGTTAPSAQELGIVLLPRGEVVELGISGSSPHYVPTGHILFSRGNAVMAVPFSLRRLRVSRSPESVLEGAFVDTNWRTSISIAQNGTLAYVSAGRSASRLVRVDRRGGTSVLPGEPQPFRVPNISDDGRNVALAIGGSLGDDIWVYNLDSRTLMKMTEDGTSLRPVWFDDGRSLAYLSSVRAHRVVKWQPADRSGIPQVLMRAVASVFSFDLGPPHSYLAFAGRDARGFDLWIAPSDTPSAAKPFLASAKNEILPRISANGRLLAYVSDETGRAEVYITPLPGPGARQKVSEGGGTEPVWSPSGTELFYRGPTHVHSATITDASGLLSVVARETLFEDVYQRSGGDPFGANYDVFPNGKEFLMIRGEPAGKARLFVVVNWFEELRRQMRAR